MGSLISLLGIATNTLLADQSALSVTGNNVANQNTVGYTREIVNFQSQDSVTLAGTTYGTGVTTGKGGVSVRDRVLEQRVQQQIQVQAQSDSLATALSSLQNIFGISSTNTSAATTTLGSALSSFFNSFTALEGNPSDIPTRQSVLNAATALTAAFNAASSELSTSSSTLNGQVRDTVTQVNALSSDIATLNLKIENTSPNADAGILEDKRQADIAQLSQFIGLDQITTENNGITLTTSTGAVLVGQAQSYLLVATNIAGVTHILAGIGGADLTSSITGGSLGGVLAARDQQVPAFANKLDTLAYAIGTAVNTQNALGKDGSGSVGGPIFSLPGTSAGAAGTIAIAAGVTPTSIAAAGSTEGATGSSNAVALATIAGNNIIGTQTGAGYYASFLGQLGTAVSAASSDAAVQQASLTQLTTQRDQLSAVSLDQEAANLTQYERSYQAAAKVFAIVDSLLSAALNIGISTAFS